MGAKLIQKHCVWLLIKSSFAWGLVVASPLWAAPIDDLVPHRAVYELQLDKASDKTGINQLTGRMIYEFSGSRCAGFTTRFRYVSRIEMEESPPRLLDQQTVLFETGDGSELRVSNKNYLNRELTDEFEAVAKQQDTGDKDGIMVEVTKPEVKTHYLGRAIFPLVQMSEMLNKAQSQEKIYQTTLYDDFDKGDKLTQASVIIGAKRQVEGGESVWPVTVSYFDDEKNPDGLPNYSSSFLLDKRGVSTHLVLDYGDFSMRGNLTQLELLEQAPCPQ